MFVAFANNNFPYISIQKTLEIFLSETTGPISIYLGRNVLLVILYQVYSSCHDSSKNMVPRGHGLFSLYICIKHLKNVFVRNHWTDFNITWQKCSFGDPLSRFSSSHHGASKQHGRWGWGWGLGGAAGVGGRGVGRAIKFIQKS